MNKGQVRLDRMSYACTGADGCGLAVIDGITLDVQPQEFVCVLGPSGCGKTTLIHLIAGFEKPTSGRIVVSGQEVADPGAERAMVFQHSALFPWFTVAGNIGYGIQGDLKERKVKELLKLVGLEEFEKTYPHQLYGGMRQKVSLARALALDPDVLLMDEPFAALDTFNRERLQDELLRIRGERGCTVIFVTHSIQEAVYLSDRTIVFSQRPARVTLELVIDMPFPRKRTDPVLWELSQRLYAKCGCCSENQDHNDVCKVKK